MKEIQDRGQEALKKGVQPDWTDVHILQNMDPKELGSSISATKYSIQLASTYLESYKFSSWTNHSDGRPVTASDKQTRALEIATLLCSHDHWKAHSHGISRDVAWKQLRLKIKYPEDIDGLQGALRKLWAIMYFLFQGTDVRKLYISQDYALVRSKPGKQAK